MTEEVKAEMLPCPFCGSEAEMSFYMKGESKDVAGFYVECCSCSAGGEPFDIQGEMPDRDEYTKSKAIAAWNSRTPSTEEMVKVLEAVKVHLHAMQNQARQYIEPSGYTSFDRKRIAFDYDQEAKDSLFVGDMIYLLDGPEQRALEAKIEALLSSVGKATNNPTDLEAPPCTPSGEE